ncbi:MAG: DNA-protecting protein DprA [Deltaproteobacteria bacterium]|nr:MAG: DNA-protecting protein DprA [Deltaproteobacteria bacterium]
MVEATLSPAKGSSVTAPTRDDYAPWLALGRVKGLGCAGFKKLAARFTDPTKIFSASAAELAQVEGLHREVIDGLLNFSAWVEVEQEIRRTREAGIELVPFTSPNYPARLRMITDPPPFLYVKGTLRAEDDKAVAIVGSRSASDYGRRMARDLARGLANLGFTVISGMARGIDGTAHDTVLQSGGRTIAVLGSGIDRAYPPEHGNLYRRISESGAVISELPIGTRPMAFHFPARNRLISGLSLGVVVVEATEKSGSLITAAMAVEQGREVFAVPGEAGASRSRGAHRLIRQGAKLVETVDDIIEEIAPQLLHRSGRAVPAAPRTLPPSASETTRKIFALLQENTLQVDQVIERSALPAAQVLEILLDLELQGFIRQSPGNIYIAER